MAFPSALALKESFKRAEENPFAKVEPFIKEWGTIGKQEIGRVTEESYTGISTFSGNKPAGVYWKETTYTAPQAAALIHGEPATERWFALYVCLSEPASAEFSGYRLTITCTKQGASSEYTFTSEKVVKGAATTIQTLAGVKIGKGNQFGVSVEGGKVNCWKFISSWSNVMGVTDTTFTSGYSGIGLRGSSGGVLLQNFETGGESGSVVPGKASGTLILAGTAKGFIFVIGHATGVLTLGGAAKATVQAVVAGKATGTVLLAGAAKGTAANVVLGKASGTLLLTGTAKSTVAGAVQGKATGTLSLTGASSGILRAVAAGKATGSLVLTGVGKSIAANTVSGKATGTLTFTGTSKGALQEVLSSNATGTLRLGGVAKGTVLDILKAKATGTLTLTGASTGATAAKVSGKATGSLRLTGSATGNVPLRGHAVGTLRLTGGGSSRNFIIRPGVAVVKPQEREAMVEPIGVS